MSKQPTQHDSEQSTSEQPIYQKPQLNTGSADSDSYDCSTTAAISAQRLAQWCDDYLSAPAFSDYCPNGLQVDAGKPISRIITGVTACDALIQAAIDRQAQAILVHHGYFWKGESPCLVGIKGQRIRKLIQHGISLLAYHLPLDAHPEIGNNAILAKALGLTILEGGAGALYPEQTHPIGNIAHCKPQSAQQLVSVISQQLQRQPLYIAGTTNRSQDTHIQGQRQIKKVALCTGAAQDMIEQAAARGCDAFISGEISERTTHSARELGIDYFACGHHATERGGIEALGRQITKKLSIVTQFVDIDNPA